MDEKLETVCNRAIDTENLILKPVALRVGGELDFYSLLASTSLTQVSRIVDCRLKGDMLADADLSRSFTSLIGLVLFDWDFSSYRSSLRSLSNETMDNVSKDFASDVEIVKFLRGTTSGYREVGFFGGGNIILIGCETLLI